ncbi:helix-turn-helix transcriptional regulator [Bacillus sp. NPDC077027]|uniref:helix-turn-helix transcriptional regulator n=1 Tax=Bacillus sp. NPDC077027 TaxID=3390548 RepID=UPI003CFE1B56
MKIDRVLSIVMILISKKQVQAKELAEMHEVSLRTIYRDIDTINQAGIPIVTHQGIGGGISIVEHYRLEKKLLTDEDIQLILTALESMTSAYQFKESESVLKKIRTLFPSENDRLHVKANRVFIDLSSWGKDVLIEEKLQRLHHAISEYQPIQFRYRNIKGEVTSRKAEPHTLVLKGRHWYLYAYCQLKEAFRLFKITRISELMLIPGYFIPKPIKNEEKPWNQSWQRHSENIQLTLKINHKALIHMEEWIDEKMLRPASDGTYVTTITVPKDEWLYRFLFQFGPDIEVLEPLSIRKELFEQIKKLHNLYET